MADTNRETNRNGYQKQLSVGKVWATINGHNTLTISPIYPIATEQEGSTLLISAPEVQSHMENFANPHRVSKAQVGLARVENKSSEEIRSELTASNVTGALGFNPATRSKASRSSDGLMSSDDKIKLDGIDETWRGTVLSVGSGIGLTGGPITRDGEIKLKLKSEEAHTQDSSDYTNMAGRQYPIGIDRSGFVSVNVPWTDTTYPLATHTNDGRMAAADKKKLDEIESNAEVNQNAFVQVQVDSSLISSTDKNDKLTLTTGSNVILTPDAATKSIKIAAVDTTYVPVTQTHDGLAIASDKKKLDSMAYGTCSTGAGTAAKVVSATDWKLQTGSRIAVKFTNANTAANVTLNVNGQGAKSIKQYGTTGDFATYTWMAGSLVEFIYDGTNFLMLNGSQAGTGSYGLTKLSSAHDSSSEVLAATPKAVKDTYDMGFKKLDSITIAATSPITVSGDTTLNSNKKSGTVTIAHKAYDKRTSTVADTAPGFGETFVVDNITSDETGHVTSMTAKTITVPSAVVTQSANGLAIASDKKKLDCITYGLCQTAEGTAQKEVATSDDFVLQAGARIAVKFTNSNSQASPTLKVNSNTAKSIVKYGTTADLANFRWPAGAAIEFVYDGDRFIALGIWNTASTSIYGLTKLTNSTNSSSTTTAATPNSVKSAYDLASAALPKTGGTMSGFITLHSDPTSNTHAATKKYVDDSLAAAKTYADGKMIFSKIAIGSTTIEADTNTDTLTFVESTGITITPDATNDKITIANSGVTGVKGNSESSYRTGQVNITKGNIGLGNVDNTSDANKPVSTATQTALDGKVDKESGKQLSTNDFTDEYKNKLTGVATGAEVNQNAFSNVKVGTTTVAADSKTDTLTLVAGDNITITPDATNDKITIAGKAGTVTSVATGAGLTGGTFTTYGTIKANLLSETKLTNASSAATETAGRVYPVALDKDGKLAVNVPWTDTDTNTHLTGSLFAAAASNSTSKATTDTTNSATYVILRDNSTNSSIQLTGSGATSVSAKNNVLTISSTNTTYTFATGASNGQIKVTPLNGTDQNIDVKGLGSAAYQNTDYFALASHSHSYVPTTRKVNNKALSADITLNASDVGASASNHTHDYSSTYAAKSHTHSDYVNQNAFSKVTINTSAGVASSTINSGSATDTLSLTPGSNISFSSSGKTITVSATDTKYSVFSTSAEGLVPKKPASTTETVNDIVLDKYLKADGTWASPPTFYKWFTDDATNLKKSSNALSHNSGRQYALTFDADSKLSVNVPWTDTWIQMTGATSSGAGGAGYVPAPAAGDQSKFLRGDGSWQTVSSGTSYTAGTGINISGTTIKNTGVTSVTQGPDSGTISVVTNGITAKVKPLDLKTAAYCNSTDFASSTHNHSASDINSGTLAIARGGTGNGYGYVRAGLVNSFGTATNSTHEGYQTYANSSYSHTEGIGSGAGLMIHRVAVNYTKNSSTIKLYHAENSYTLPTQNSYLYYLECTSSLMTVHRASVTNVSYSSSDGYSTCTISPGIGAAIEAGEGGWVALVKSSYSDYQNAGSHAEGIGTMSGLFGAHSEGWYTAAAGKYSHSEGYLTLVGGSANNASAGHAEGWKTTAKGSTGAHAEGVCTVASGEGAHAGGCYTKASAKGQTAIGSYNIEKTSNSDGWLIVGKGSSESSRANAFRVGSSNVYGGTYGSIGSSGDYAEMFEWDDSNVNNEDRRGRFVTLDGEKIKYAESSNDYILGIVSSNPTVLGDACSDQWSGMYEMDIYGSTIYEDVEVPAETMIETDPETGEEKEIVVREAYTEHRQKLNPNYDPSLEYKARSERPEWSPVGMMGKLVMVDDGTSEVNGWVKPSTGGIATKSEERTKYRVMKRIDESHIKVLILP